MIYQKLLEFQKKNITIEKDGENPHFKSSYATLNEVLSKVKKPLNDLGVVIIQIPTKDGLITRLVDTDEQPTIGKAENGEQVIVPSNSVECFMPYVGADTAQKLGSANTYNRRYSLVTLLGLEDQDDDGNVASAPTVKKGKVHSIDELDDPF